MSLFIELINQDITILFLAFHPFEFRIFVHRSRHYTGEAVILPSTTYEHHDYMRPLKIVPIQFVSSNEKSNTIWSSIVAWNRSFVNGGDFWGWGVLGGHSVFGHGRIEWFRISFNTMKKFKEGKKKTFYFSNQIDSCIDIYTWIAEIICLRKRKKLILYFRRKSLIK